MKREDALRLCKIYGKNLNYNDPDYTLFENAEERFVEAIVNEDFPTYEINEYKAVVLPRFNHNDGISIGLTAILYQVFMHAYETSSVNQFKSFYDKYLSI